MGFNLTENQCCLNLKNLKETMRRTEGKKEFIWVQCKVCNQVFLKSKLQKKCRVSHG